MCVHALVGQPERELGGAGFAGKHDHANRRANRVVGADLSQRARDREDHLIRVLTVQIEVRAELIAAQAIGATVAVDRAAQLRCEA